MKIGQGGGGLEAGGLEKASVDLGKTVELLFDCLLHLLTSE